ncbi:hypothetical protein NFX39_00755 [Fructobacillus sp. W13]|uniref:Uncharacterized protein n=1 Tax=Fructobacillus apis TaxID=2935017 RepID=A0ABT0ZNQ1_9LACO|nr:hypothetical protein [Fructobacillus apis]MCO0831624.1 hypothetical protein [Fructobacillus apis]
MNNQLSKSHVLRNGLIFLVVLLVVMTTAFILGSDNARTNSNIKVNQPSTSHKLSKEESESQVVQKANGDEDNKNLG